MKYLRYAALGVGLAVGMIAGYEGKSNKAYLDLVQVPTICYGSTRNVRLGDVKSDNECTLLLRQEVDRIDMLVTTRVHVELQPHERAAIISLVYNIGDGNFIKSTLLKKLNQGDIKGACNQFPRWVYAKGKRIQGLVNRRADERLICLGEK